MKGRAPINEVASGAVHGVLPKQFHEPLQAGRDGVTSYAAAWDGPVMADSFSVNAFFPEAVISRRSFARVIPT